MKLINCLILFINKEKLNILQLQILYFLRRRKTLKNILKNIKSNPFILGIIGSIIGGILILLSIPIAKLLMKLLFSWSNRLSLFILNFTIRLAIANYDFTGFVTFYFVFVLIIMAICSDFFQIPAFYAKKKSGVNIRPRKYIFAFTIFIYCLFFLPLIIINNSAKIINLNQIRRMEIIAPYIDDQKEEELWSEWYLLRSKRDYVNLNYEIDNIAENNNVELPKID